MKWNADLEQRLRKTYPAKYKLASKQEDPKVAFDRVERVGDDSLFLEKANRFFFATPAQTVSAIEDVPTPVRSAWEAQTASNPYFGWVQGRLVEAEKPNSNGHMWSTSDLEFGSMSVKHGPFNFAHEPHHILGSIADNFLVSPSGDRLTAAAERPYIAVLASVWKFLWPQDFKAIQASSDSGDLFLSMECVSERVHCASSGERIGCDSIYSYQEFVGGQTCEHLRTRSSAMRLVNPSFLGMAAIVPPVRPGWSDAYASVMPQAAKLGEYTHDHVGAHLSDEQWTNIMANVILYTNR